MKKILSVLSGFFGLITLVSIQTSVTSCSKETEIIRDTVIVRDTVTVRDTILSEYEKIKAHINDGLWAHFPIDGSTADLSGNNRQLVLKDGAALSHDRWGRAENAINFNGLTAYATIPDGEQFSSQSFTVSFYVLTKSYKGLMFGKQDFATARGASFNVGYDQAIDGQHVRFATTENQANICNEEAVNSIKAIQKGVLNYYQWYHVAVTHDSNEKEMKLYINGTAVDSTSHQLNALNLCNNGEFVLGAWWNNDRQSFNGKMDNIRIYERALSAKEIKYLGICDKSVDYVEKTQTDLLTSKTWIYNEYFDNYNLSTPRLLYKLGKPNNSLNLSGDWLKFNADGTFSRRDLNGVLQTGTWNFIENGTKLRTVENGVTHTSTLIILSEDQYVFHDVPYNTYGEMVPKD
jgi:hypothetical protein